ncbi:flagellar biosynthesis protein FlhF [Brevibacillus sp. SYP-B805]|uniref:flagellar biosynthesis protein FlhF n=1 Tax=Brevibacillus sp. SYP-B805 TaxID=1578199 RepID=UPI0013ECEDB1|nr:flagellar biosynthesis protein FlhF [Brevibacillus sp. SYP-B805]
MRVKRYIVDTMPDALEKIRQELGKDAIILNTKPVKTGGFLGLFSKQQIEVIAAVDQKATDREKADAAIKHDRTPAPVNGHVAAQAYKRTSGTAMADRPLAAWRETAEETRPQHRPAAPAATAAPSIQPIATPSAHPTAKPGEKKAAAEDPHELARELRDMREMFRKLLLKGQESYLPAPVLAVRNRLQQQDVDDELISSIISELLKRMEDPTRYSDEDAHKLAAVIVKAMLTEKSSMPARIERSAKYAFFFGPTGVGKTTTIAKLAAECMLKEKRKVGFITSDTYRIAAVEQLKTYANILNVPLEVVFSPKEIEQAMERLKHCDLVLVDTAGRNYRNDEYVAGIKELLAYGDASVHYLVLSLTARYADMKAIAAHFCDIPDARVIFTKADETRAYGTILNIVKQYGLSLSYITTGQNVPDDIILATPEKVTNMIVGDETYA